MPMATADALTGVGVPAQVANLLGANPSTLTGAANNTQTGAAILKSRNTELNPGASTNSFLPPPTAAVMEPYFLVNLQSTTANLFVPVGHSLNGSLNASVAVAQNKSVIFWQYKPKNWTYNLTA